MILALPLLKDYFCTQLFMKVLDVYEEVNDKVILRLYSHVK